MPRTKKPENYETLAMALELLRRIPRVGKVSSTELMQALQGEGFERDQRTVQRMLKDLCVRFDIERDERSLPYGYRWKAHNPGFMVPALGRQESIMLMLAEQQLKPLLPPSVLKSMDGFFKQARTNLAEPGNTRLEKQWLSKVRVVSETQPLLPPKLADGVLEAVSEALYSNHWLDVDYTNQKDERKTHRVMPLGLAQQGPRMYLVCRFEAYDNQRILALHRINAATHTGLPFDRPEAFDLAAYDGEGHFAVGNGQRIRLQFDIAKSPGRHLLESPLAEDQNVQFTPEGYTITATVQQTLLLDRWLLSFGGQIRNVSKTPVDA